VNWMRRTERRARAYAFTSVVFATRARLEQHVPCASRREHQVDQPRWRCTRAALAAQDVERSFARNLVGYGRLVMRVGLQEARGGSGSGRSRSRPAAPLHGPPAACERRD